MPQRSQDRYRPRSLKARISGEIYDVFDISATGAFISRGPDWMVEGQGIRFDLVIVQNLEEKTIPVKGVVVRKDADGLAVVYESPAAAWAKLLPKIARI